MAKTPDFEPVFQELKDIMQQHEGGLKVEHDEPDNYYLMAGHSERYNKDIFFGAVQIKKSYVSYHLMPVYMYPELRETVSPELQKRMQGKSCFNFKQVDSALFKELADLTERGFQRLQEDGLI